MVSTRRHTILANHAEQFGLENELALLVFLRCFVGLVVLPADGVAAAAAANVSHDVAAGRHVTLRRFARLDVDHGVEEIGLAMLSSKVLSRQVLDQG